MAAGCDACCSGNLSLVHRLLELGANPEHTARVCPPLGAASSRESTALCIMRDARSAQMVRATVCAAAKSSLLQPMPT